MQKVFIAIFLLAIVFYSRTIKGDEGNEDDVEKDEYFQQTESKSSDNGHEEPDELKIEVLKKVDNCKYRSQWGDTLTWHYTGTLVDGTVFDSSVGKNPYWATLGRGQIIKGVDDGMLDMCEGEIRRLTVPPHMGYGAQGYPGSIPPHATLIFENELLKIDREEHGGEL